MKKSVVAAFVAASCFLTGCSGASIYSQYHETDSLELIRTLGVDASDGSVTVIAGTGTGADDKAPRIYEKSGASLAAAVHALQDSPTGKETLFSHTEEFVIGEEAARAGMGEYLDFVARLTEVRLKTDFYIAVGVTAKDLMQGVYGKETSASDMLYFLRQDAPFLSSGYVSSCGEVIKGLAENGAALAMAIGLTESGATYEGAGEKAIAPLGLAVIKDAKLEKVLSPEQTRGALILTGNFKYDETVETYEDVGVTLGVTQADVRVRPVFSKDKLERVVIELDCKAVVEEAVLPVDPQDEKVRDALEDIIAQREKTAVESAVTAAQETGTDFLGIGPKIEMKEPVKFDKLRPEWKEIFPQTEFEIVASAQIERTYDVVSPIDMSGGEKEESLWEKLIK